MADNANNNVQIAAFWLLGVAGAFRIRGFPKWLDRQEFFRHEDTALKVSRNAAFTPMPLWELVPYVERLSQRISPPLRLNKTKSPPGTRG